MAAPLRYSLAEMQAKSGGPLRWKVEQVAAELAVRVSEHLVGMPSYRVLKEILPSKRTDLYFEMRVKGEIHPLVRTLCVLQWYERHGQSIPERRVIWHGHRGLDEVVLPMWPDPAIPLVPGKARIASQRLRSSARRLRAWTQVLLREAWRWRCWDQWDRQSVPTDSRPAPGAAIAVHFLEGIDLSRRSEFFWLSKSGVEPSRVIAYIDFLDLYTRRPIAESVLRQIEAARVRWVCMERGSYVARGSPPLWRPGLATRDLLKKFRKRRRLMSLSHPGEAWLVQAAEELLREVGYWEDFYRSFGIRLHIDPEEGTYRNIAQSVALDLIGGIRIGKQRSESQFPEGFGLGYLPHHVFFSWGSGAQIGLQNGRNRIDYMIMSGFTNDAAFRTNSYKGRTLREKLESRGARFIVALYDNVHGPDIHFSEGMVRAFYMAFLDWLSEEYDLGIIVKSKKPFVLENLSDVRERLTHAQAEGRCIVLDNPRGRLPSEASLAADIAVGIGISSAVIEAVIGGCRGIHCDLAGMRFHPFYQWGYEKVVFDDLARMLAALRRFKKDPSVEPELGHYGPMLEEIDPFRDGRAGERVGTYIRWLVEAFDDGLERDAAIQKANEKYAGVWGADKVIWLDPVTAETVGAGRGTNYNKIPR